MRLSQYFLRLLAIFLALISSVGCAGSGRPPASEAPPEAVAAHGFLQGSAGRARSHRLDFPIELPLPDKPGWQIAEGPTWFVADHRPSSSQLALRTWRADRVVRRSECEAQARLVRPTIPIVKDEEVVERRALTAPADFDNELVVGVEPNALGLSGYALVIGAGVGRCYAAVFTTSVRGKDAEPELAARLGLVVDRVLSHIRARSVDERAPRRHLVVSPKAAPD
jgi:hypothetical protein